MNNRVRGLQLADIAECKDLSGMKVLVMDRLGVVRWCKVSLLGGGGGSSEEGGSEGGVERPTEMYVKYKGVDMNMTASTGGQSVVNSSGEYKTIYIDDGETLTLAVTATSEVRWWVIAVGGATAELKGTNGNGYALSEDGKTLVMQYSFLENFKGASFYAM